MLCRFTKFKCSFLREKNKATWIKNIYSLFRLCDSGGGVGIFSAMINLSRITIDVHIVPSHSESKGERFSVDSSFIRCAHRRRPLHCHNNNEQNDDMTIPFDMARYYAAPLYLSAAFLFCHRWWRELCSSRIWIGKSINPWIWTVPAPTIIH